MCVARCISINTFSVTRIVASFIYSLDDPKARDEERVLPYYPRSIKSYLNQRYFEKKVTRIFINNDDTWLRLENNILEYVRVFSFTCFVYLRLRRTRAEMFYHETV